eukprot:3775075-Pleurochrysis_carterae.AAC.1
MQDPQIRFIREACIAPREDRETWSRQRTRTAREHMLAYCWISMGWCTVSRSMDRVCLCRVNDVSL